MVRAIDADALWKEVEPYGLHKGCIIGKHGGLADILMDIIEKQPTLDPVKQEWISVKDRLPEYFELVLLWDAIDQDVFMGELDGDGEGKWFVRGYSPDDFNITHWMPMPEPPERDDE